MTDVKARCEYVAYPGWPDRWRCVYVADHPRYWGHSVAYDGQAAPPKKVNA